MASVTIRLHGAFSDMAGSRKANIDAATVGEALDALPAQLPGLRERIRDEQGRIRAHLNVFHNEEEIRRLEGEATPLHDGDVIHLMPAVSGGWEAVKAKKVAVMVGTRKGAYIFRSGAGRSRWTSEGPLFQGEPVHHLAFDHRDGVSMFAACNLTWGGPKIRVSRDQGRTWEVASNPAFPKGKVSTTSKWEIGKDFPTQVTEELAFQRTWHIEPGHPSQPNVVWAGVEPAALFRSDDRGMTWQEVSSLTDHPTRSEWAPGGGGLTLHSIAIDAGDSHRMQVGISSAGVFETKDGGKTWAPRNQGIPNPFDPKSEREVGYCVHKLVAHPTAPGVRFQQNHFAVMWLRDGDRRWVQAESGLPRAAMQSQDRRSSAYGFAAAMHPHDPDTAYLFPLDGRDRMAPEPGIAIYMTRDRGSSWKRLAKGLPRGAREEVMREGLATDRLDPAGVYFGTQAGELWGSNDEGKTWERIAQYLPPVMSVSAATY